MRQGEHKGRAGPALEARKRETLAEVVTVNVVLAAPLVESQSQG